MQGYSGRLTGKEGINMSEEKKSYYAIIPANVRICNLIYYHGEEALND